MTTLATDYLVRPFQAGDRDAVLNLLEQALAGGPTGRRTAAFFRWKHEENPFGHSPALVAETPDGELAGFRSFMRWRFRSGAQTVPAVRAVDTATHPDHQGRGIFTRLTRAALETLRESAALVFNTPNGNSLPGYLKMGWRPVGRIPIAVHPARPLRFLRGAATAGRGGAGGTPPACGLPPAAELLGRLTGVHDLLAISAVGDPRLTTDRSPAYLRWRYGAAPDLGYRGVALHRGAELTGLALGRARWRGRLREFTLSEVLVRDGDVATARQLLSAVNRSGCDHVSAHLAASASLQRAGLARGYVTLPRTGLTLVANVLAPVQPDPLQLSSWRLSLGDLEVF